MMQTPTRFLPTTGMKSPRFGHLGVWIFGLGPNSPVPSERLQIAILDEKGAVVRRFEQIKGDCIDPGYVDFFISNKCQPALHELPIVDIDAKGHVVKVLHPHFVRELGPDLFFKIQSQWSHEHGSSTYAL